MDDKNHSQETPPGEERGPYRTRREFKQALKMKRWEARQQRKEARWELRRQIHQSNPSGPSVFWGLMLIMWAVIIFLSGRHLLATGDIWKAVIIGLGTIFIIQSFIKFLNPTSRPTTTGRLIPGLILIFVGLANLYGFNDWWPLFLVIAGAALLFSSWFLQKEIEKRRFTQESLRESEVKYRHIVDNATSIIMEVDTVGNITFMNKFALDFFGYTEEEIKGRSVFGAILPDDPTARAAQETMSASIAQHPEGYLHNESENLLKNGAHVWILWTYKPIFDEANQLKEILCIGIDRTEQKRADELSARELKEKTAAEERSRLARDLHDAVSQTLFSATLVADVLPRIWEESHEEGLKGLEEVRQLTRGALAEMRTLLFELRPAALVDAELAELLHQLTESVMGRVRLPVALEIEGTCTVPPDVKIAFYRIAQEALNNIIKHAQATSARIVLVCEPKRLSMSIIDNGQGFDTRVVSPNGFGLGNIRERAAHIGASLNIESHPGNGTEVTVVWQAKE